MQGNRSSDEGVGTLAQVTEFFGQWDLNDARRYVADSGDRGIESDFVHAQQVQ